MENQVTASSEEEMRKKADEMLDQTSLEDELKFESDEEFKNVLRMIAIFSVCDEYLQYSEPYLKRVYEFEMLRAYPVFDGMSKKHQRHNMKQRRDSMKLFVRNLENLKTKIETFVNRMGIQDGPHAEFIEESIDALHAQLKMVDFKTIEDGEEAGNTEGTHDLQSGEQAVSENQGGKPKADRGASSGNKGAKGPKKPKKAPSKGV